MNNGQLPEQVPIQWVARLYQATPDAQQWEVRLTALALQGGGARELFTLTAHAWEGGVEVLRNLTPMAAQLAVQLTTQKISGLITQV